MPSWWPCAASAWSWRERRPRDAGVVVERVVAYQDAVQERLDKAKQEQAAAQAAHEEERGCDAWSRTRRQWSVKCGV